MEPIITTTALASFLSLLFTEGGKTLAAEGVKLALEKREDIKNGFVNLFKGNEIIKLGLDEEKNPEQITALLKANPEVAETVTQRLEESKLLDQLLEIIKEQPDNKSSNITTNADKIGQIINDNHGTINQTVNFGKSNDN